MDKDTRLGHSKGLISIIQSSFNKRPFCLNHFELCNLMRVGRKQHISLKSTLFQKKLVGQSLNI